MKTFGKIWCVCLLTLSWAAGASAEPGPRVNTMADRVMGLSMLWSEIKYNFVGIDRVEFDIDSLYHATLERVLDAPDDIEYYNELGRFMAAFGDGHTYLIYQYPFEQNDYIDTVPIHFDYFGEKMYVVGLRNDVDSSFMGAEVVEIDGLPTNEYMERNLFPLIGIRSRMPRLQAAAGFFGLEPTGTVHEVKFRKRGGEVVDYRLSYDLLKTWDSERDYVWTDLEEEEGRSEVELSWADGDVAVLRIDGFWQTTAAVDSLMRLAAPRAEGMVIDLRENGGGSTLEALNLQMWLQEGDSVLCFGSQSRSNNGYGRSQGNYREEYEDDYLYRAYYTEAPEWERRHEGVGRIDCPVVVLIGPESASACEDFLVNIYEVPGRPLLVGGKTAGTTGAPLVMWLPHKVPALICTLRIMFPYSGKPFTEGIDPDIEVARTIDDVFAGRDPVLERGLEEVGGMIARGEVNRCGLPAD